jgi:hypothetical protein
MDVVELTNSEPFTVDSTCVDASKKDSMTYQPVMITGQSLMNGQCKPNTMKKIIFSLLILAACSKPECSDDVPHYLLCPIPNSITTRDWYPSECDCLDKARENNSMPDIPAGYPECYCKPVK